MRTEETGDAGAVQGWVDELAGRRPCGEREGTEWESILEGVAGALLSASSWPGHEGHPRLLLDEIVHRTLSPGARARREALERALLRELSKRQAIDDVVFLLRELALVGSGASVPALERLLAGAKEPLRGWVLRALAANPSPESGATLEAALDGAEGDEARTALAGALRAHRGLAAHRGKGGAEGSQPSRF